jgi:hypothetical protein
MSGANVKIRGGMLNILTRLTYLTLTPKRSPTRCSKPGLAKKAAWAAAPVFIQIALGPVGEHYPARRDQSLATEDTR